MEKYASKESIMVDTINNASFFQPTHEEHSCETQGCGKALVIDGNMKNHRSVCFATNAGYVEYEGLTGRARTGCPNTPDYRSIYCDLHKPVLAVPCHGSNDSPQHKPTKEPIGLIIGKRETRTSILYEVSAHAL